LIHAIKPFNFLQEKVDLKSLLHRYVRYPLPKQETNSIWWKKNSSQDLPFGKQKLFNDKELGKKVSLWHH